MQVQGMYEKAEKEYTDLLKKKKIVEGDKSKVPQQLGYTYLNGWARWKEEKYYCVRIGVCVCVCVMSQLLRLILSFHSLSHNTPLFPLPTSLCLHV